MAELDFSKIFGETATSKASFTDENYLNGWGYLGSTPPPYQLFDYLQSLNDKKSKYLHDKTIENDNKLALHNTNATAHTDIRTKITSDINSHNSNTSAHADIRAKITSDINSHNTNGTAHADIRTKITSDINSHNTNGTAHADIRTKITSDMNAHNTSSSAHAAILNAIKAISGTDAYDIAPSKTISSLIPLVGYGGIVAQRLEPNGYIKFANGLILQWGYSEVVNTYDSNYKTTVTFPIASNVIGVLPALFDNDSRTFSSPNYNNSLSISVLKFDNTKADILIDIGASSGPLPHRDVKAFYIAIGL